MDEVFQDQINKRTQMVKYLSQYLFIFVFLAGTGGITIIKLLQFRFDLNFVTIISIPIIFMVGYLITILLFKELLWDVRSADNLYYLGLLFTLVSLLFSLYQFEGHINQISNIIKNFGIALTSTIFGLAFRVFLIHFQNDYTNVEEEISRNIVHSAQKLKDELQGVVSDVNNFRKEINQSHRDTTRELIENTKVTIDNINKDVNGTIIATSSKYADQMKFIFDVITDAIETHIKSHSEMIRVANDKLQSNFNNVSNAIELSTKAINENISISTENAKKLNLSSRKILSTTDRLIDQVEKIEIPNSIIVDGLNVFISKLEDLGKVAFENQLRIIDSQTQINNRVIEGTNRFDVFNSQIAKLGFLGDNLDNLNSILVNTFSKLREINTQFENYASNYKTIIESLGKDVEFAMKYKEDIRTEVDKAKMTTIEMYKSMHSLANVILDSVKQETKN